MSKAKNYKIVPIKHLLKNNRMAKAGEVVLGSAFSNLQSAIDNGICVETSEKITSELSNLKVVDDTSDEAKKAAKKAAKKLAKKLAEEEAAAAAKALESKDDESGVDLNLLSEDEIISFAKENKYTLSAAIKKQGKDAMIEEIIRQSN